MKKLVVLLGLAMFMATSAFAVVDPDDNMLGCYWDLNADVNLVAPMPAPMNMYVILTNPTFDAVAGFEFGITIEAAVAPYLLGVVHYGAGATDMFVPFDDYMVGLATPLVTTEATALVAINVGNFAGVPLDIFLHGCSIPSVDVNLPAMLMTDDSIVAVGTSTLPGTVNCMQGFEPGPVATEAASWDNVKSMYR